MAAAQELQAVVSRADFYLAQHGIGGAKWAISRYAAELGYGYSAGIPRRPLPETNQAAGPVIEKELEEVMQWERKLTQQQV